MAPMAEPIPAEIAAGTPGAPEHGSPAFAAGAELLRALAHPARLQIAVELDRGDRCVHELTDLLGLAQPTISQHLQVLRAARLVTGTRVGREIRYSLSDHHVGHIAIDAVAHAAESVGQKPQRQTPNPTNPHEEIPHEHHH
jgi:DNA-binding transcriptional ArsR family regulator